jgi:DNA-binding LacI/PurR family transcriptional regulator
MSVAERAGVSKSLVSLVMRGAPNVSEERRRAVLAAADELGYRPNLVARNLAERRTRTIGVLVSDLHNPFFAEIIDALQAEARTRDRRVLLGTGRRDAAEEAEVVESFLQQDVEGLVLLSPVLDRDSLGRGASAVPTVVVGTTAVRAPRCDVIINDDALGAELALAHLIALGHERVAHIDGQTGPGAEERRAGYLTAMARHRLEPQIASGEFTDEGGYRAGRALLEGSRTPTAIFACNDLAAIGAMTALEEAGLSVPGDVSLVGYDNTSLAQIRHLWLTSVDNASAEVGQLAARALLRRIADPAADATEQLIRPTLQVRGSTGPPARP